MKTKHPRNMNRETFVTDRIEEVRTENVRYMKRNINFGRAGERRRENIQGIRETEGKISRRAIWKTREGRRKLRQDKAEMKKLTPTGGQRGGETGNRGR